MGESVWSTYVHCCIVKFFVSAQIFNLTMNIIDKYKAIHDIGNKFKQEAQRGHYR